jgi:hypothetical protein
MRTYFRFVATVLSAFFLGACGAQADSAAATASTASGSGAAAPVAQKTGRELVNPDAATMVFLYYELAKMTPPFDNWVEDDNRVKFAPAPEKAAKRVAVRQELQSAHSSVKGIGALRLTMDANLSDYDPTYGEFTVRALAPSSVVTFNALGQKLSVSFANGRTAQIWRVPAAQAQAIRDKVSTSGSIELDVLLAIDSVLPGPGGGSIVTNVVEYEMRGARNGLVIGRVKPGQP